MRVNISGIYWQWNTWNGNKQIPKQKETKANNEEFKDVLDDAMRKENEHEGTESRRNDNT
jgi:hypothetical protein